MPRYISTPASAGVLFFLPVSLLTTGLDAHAVLISKITKVARVNQMTWDQPNSKTRNTGEVHKLTLSREET